MHFCILAHRLKWMVALALWIPVAALAQRTELIQLSATYSGTSFTNPSTSVPTNIAIYVGQTISVPVTVTNVDLFTVNVTAGANYEVVINNVARRSITLHGLQDGSGNAIPGTRNYNLIVSLVPNWRSSSVYVGDSLEKAIDQTPLGSCGAMDWGVPVTYTTEDEAFNSPSLSMNMGVGRNGMPLPPLKARVELPNGKLVDDYPALPDVTVSGLQDNGGTVTVFAPQVTATIDCTKKTISFAQPGHETTPFLVYTFSGLSTYDSTKGRYTATVSRAYSGASISSLTTLYHYGQLAAYPGDPYITYWTYEDWHDSTLAAQRIVSLGQVGVNPTTSSYAVLVAVADAAGNIATKRVIGYRLDGIGLSDGNAYSWLVPEQVIEDYQGGNYLTKYFLGNRGENMDANRGQVDPSGKATIVEFNAQELPTQVSESWLNNSPTQHVASNGNTGIGTDLNGSSATWYLYTNDWNGNPLLPNSVRTTVGTTLLKETTNAYTFKDSGGATLTINGQKIYTTQSYAFAAAGTTGNATTPRSTTDGASLCTTTKKFRDDTDDSMMSGLLASVLHPDGTMTSYAYEHGTLQSDGSFTVDGGPDVRVTKISGVAPGTGSATTMTATASGAAVDSVGVEAGRSMETIDIWHAGLLARRESWINSTGTTFALLGYTNFTYTADGRLLQKWSSNGSSLASSSKTYDAGWDGDRKQYDTDAAGVKTTYDYDAMGRISARTRVASGAIPALRTGYTYDADNRLLSTAIGPVGGEQIVSSTQYDKGGRVTHAVSAEGVTSDFVYTNGGRTTTVTYAKGTTEESNKAIALFADGRTSTITGTSAIYEQHTFDFDASNRPRETITRGSSTGRTEVLVSDLQGHLVEDRTPGYGTTGTIIAYHHYNAKGQRDQTTTVLSSGGVEHRIAADHLTQYDDFGAVSADGIDLNPPATGIGTLDASSNDRFSSTTTTAVQDAQGVWWAVVKTDTYTTNGSSAVNESQAYTQLNLPSGVLSNTIAYDFYHNPTQHTVTVDTTAHTTTETTKYPDSSQTVSTSYSGLTTSIQSYASDNAATAWHSVTYAYDAQGRQASVTDSRTGTATPDYVSGTALVWKRHDANGSPGAVVATYTYDHAARVASVTDANANVTSTLYNTRGQVQQQSGSGTFPVTYDYDAYGARTVLRTYRNGLSGTADVTNWTYDPNTGWPTAKIDAAATRDSSGNVTSATGHQVTFDYVYDFTNGCKTVTRTLARNLTTKSSYDLATGDLTKVEHSDDTAHPVSFTYTRDGKLYTVTDATGTRDFSYDHGQMSAEALDTSFYAGANGGASPGLVLTTQFQTTADANPVTGRYAGYKLGYATSNSADLGKESSVKWGYDTAGRANAITATYTAAGVTVPFSYQYYAQSAAWQYLTQGSYKVTRTLEPKRDVLTAISSAYGTSIMAGYDYSTNTAGQLQWAKQSGNAFSDLGTSYVRYGYDSVGELQSATGYLGTDPTSTATPLPGRNYGYGYDTIGNRKTASLDSEQISYNSTNALNEYGSRGTLRTHVSGTATAGASVTVNGTATGPLVGAYWDLALGNFAQYSQVNIGASLSGQTATASVTVPLRPATESFVYDADGNLTDDAAWHYTYDAENRLISMTSVTSWGAPGRSLTFTYDYLGRRVRKIATGPNSGDNYTRVYLYQGWSLIAEIDGSTKQIVRSYVWGQASSLAGGGALILEAVQTATTVTAYDLAYDGNGNVAALVNASTGAFGAVYEYDPYGQLLRGDTTLPEWAANPFRFGTYYTDQESRLVYYGHRFYDPTQGRFINRDPSEEAGGVNLYGFVANNPTNHWDVLGLRNGTDPDQTPNTDDIVQAEGMTVTASRIPGSSLDDTDMDTNPAVVLSAILAGMGANNTPVSLNIQAFDSTKVLQGLQDRVRTVNSERTSNGAKLRVVFQNGHEYTIYADGTVVRHTELGDVVVAAPNNTGGESLAWGVTKAAVGGAGSYFKGLLWTGPKGLVVGTYRMVRHPINTATGLYKFGKGAVADPKGVGMGLLRAAGNTLSKPEGIGTAAFGVVSALAPGALAGELAQTEKILVIGESMEARVIPYARSIGAEIYPGMPGYSSALKAEALLDNGLYIEKAKELGYRIIDIGPDFAKRELTGQASEAYNLERYLTKDYSLYEKAFTR